MITKEEHDIIHQYVVITLTRRALEYDLSKIQKGSLKLEKAYTDILTKMLDQTSLELAMIKRFMQKNELKIISKGNDGLFSKYHYFCRGYEGNSSYLNIHLKNQVIHYLTHNILQIDHIKHP